MKHFPGIFLSLLVLAGLSAINFSHGFSEDYDGYFVISKAQALPDEGYTPSRSWGFPAYEVFIYPIIHYLGIEAAKFYSLAFSLGSVVVFYLILFQIERDGGKLFFGTLSFVVLPVTIVAGNTVLETGQGIFFALSGILFYLRYRSKPAPLNFYLMAIGLGFAVSTRPDYVLLSAAVAYVVLMYNRPGSKLLLIGLLLWSISALLPYAIYEGLYFSADVVPPDSYLRRFIRGALGIVNLYGIFAVGILLLWGVVNYRRYTGPDKPVAVLIGITSLLFILRFVMLPDELEYIYILAPLLVILLLLVRISRKYLILLTISLFIPNLVQVHFFERTETGDVKVTAGVSPGVIAQEKNKRLLNEYRVDRLRILKQQVAENYGFSGYVGEPTVKDGVLVIIPRESLRYYRQDRWSGVFYNAVCKQKVIVYPMPENRAWRQFIKFEDWEKIQLADFQKVSFRHCN